MQNSNPFNRRSKAELNQLLMNHVSAAIPSSVEKMNTDELKTHLHQNPDLIARVQNDLVLSEEVLRRKKILASVLREMQDWGGQIDGGVKLTLALSRISATRSHHLLQAARENKLMTVNSRDAQDPNRQDRAIQVVSIPEEFLDNPQIFLIQHDWNSALGPAIEEVLNNGTPAAFGMSDEEFKEAADIDIDSDEFMLPYDTCFFEFRLHKYTTAILMAKQVPGHMPKIRLFLEFREAWLSMDSTFADLKNHLWKQVVALTVSLEAEVTETDIISPDAPVNKKRLKHGKVPMFSYHVVRLAKRFTQRRASDSQEYQGIVRLHFRKGHRRRYPTYSKWIKWTLVGNPDLGFIAKHYLSLSEDLNV